MNIRVMYASRTDTPTKQERQFFDYLTKLIEANWLKLKFNTRAKLHIEAKPLSLQRVERARDLEGACDITAFDKTLLRATARDFSKLRPLAFNTIIAELKTQDPARAAVFDGLSRLKQENILVTMGQEAFERESLRKSAASPSFGQRISEILAPSEQESRGLTTHKRDSQEILLLFSAKPEPKEKAQLASINYGLSCMDNMLFDRTGRAYATWFGGDQFHNLNFPLAGNLDLLHRADKDTTESSPPPSPFAPVDDDEDVIGKHSDLPWLDHNKVDSIPSLVLARSQQADGFIRNLLLKVARDVETPAPGSEASPPSIVNSDIEKQFQVIDETIAHREAQPTPQSPVIVTSVSQPATMVDMSTLVKFASDYDALAGVLRDKGAVPLDVLNLIAEHSRMVASLAELNPTQIVSNQLRDIVTNKFNGTLSLEEKAQILGLGLTRIYNTGAISVFKQGVDGDKVSISLTGLITSLQSIDTKAAASTAGSNGAHSVRQLFTAVKPVSRIEPVVTTFTPTPANPVRAGDVVNPADKSQSKPLPPPTPTAERYIDRKRWNPDAGQLQEIKDTVEEQRKKQKVGIEELITICQGLAGTEHTITSADANSIRGQHQISLGDRIIPRKSGPGPGKKKGLNFKAESSPEKLRANLNRYQKLGERLLLKDLFFAYLLIERKFLDRAALVAFKHEHDIRVVDVSAKVTVSDRAEATDDEEPGAVSKAKAEVAAEREKLTADARKVEELYRLSSEDETRCLTNFQQYTGQWRGRYGSLNVRDLTVIYIALTDRVPDEQKVRAIAADHQISIDDNEEIRNSEYLKVAELGLDKALSSPKASSIPEAVVVVDGPHCGARSKFLNPQATGGKRGKKPLINDIALVTLKGLVTEFLAGHGGKITREELAVFIKPLIRKDPSPILLTATIERLGIKDNIKRKNAVSNGDAPRHIVQMGATNGAPLLEVEVSQLAAAASN